MVIVDRVVVLCCSQERHIVGNDLLQPSHQLFALLTQPTLNVLQHELTEHKVHGFINTLTCLGRCFKIVHLALNCLVESLRLQDASVR